MIDSSLNIWYAILTEGLFPAREYTSDRRTVMLEILSGRRSDAELVASLTHIPAYITYRGNAMSQGNV